MALDCMLAQDPVVIDASMIQKIIKENRIDSKLSNLVSAFYFHKERVESLTKDYTNDPCDEIKGKLTLNKNLMDLKYKQIIKYQNQGC